MPDGHAHVVVFSSPKTRFTEPFLFNVGYGLVGNGSSVSGSAQLRLQLVQRAVDTRFPSGATDLRVVKVLRQGLMVYLELVMTRIPRAVLRSKV